MTKLTTSLATVAALLCGGLVATPAHAAKESARPGVLHVIDNADLFSTSAISAAEAEMKSVKFNNGLSLTIDTHPSLPDNRKAEFDAATSDAERAAVFEAWAKLLYNSKKASGIYVLISKSPGAVVVLAEKEIRNRGFTSDDDIKLREMIRSGLRQAATKPAEEQTAARDDTLKSAVNFVVTNLKDTAVSATGAASGQPAQGRNAGSSNIAGWVCLGLSVMLGAWLVIGLIRAFSGGGSGAGGPGGGGGFMSSLFGGLFGAMAGMWLYNSMFSGGGMFGGSDASANEGGMNGDTGSGDLADDTGSAGYDGGDYGGGDFGGGDFGDF